ncbi:MAG: WD40/YVTN/BNR-like repeat-containing protein [Blastocatellia bacterium]
MLRPFVIVALFALLLLNSSPKAEPELGWTSQSSGALAKLSGVFFVDRDHGWITGSNGVLLATENGGAKWSRQTLPERQKTEALNDIWFFNAERGLLLGEYGVFNRGGDVEWSERIFLLTSNDRGATWEASALARLPAKPVDIAAIKKTSEGPEMIKPGQRPPDPVLARMAFANERVGWACGEAGTIQYTKDGGATWQIQPTLVRKLLYDVAAIGDKQACVVGAGGSVLLTADGGQTWNEQSSGVTQTLRAVHFVDANRGWAVGSQGTIITTADGGARWQAQTSGATQNLNDVFFVSAKEGWVASDRGVLLRTIDGGATWETVEVGTRANLTRLFFIAPDCGWVVGASGAIFRYGSGD